MPLPTIDENYFTTFLVDLLNIPSPTGFAEPAIEFVEKELSKYKQLQLSRTRKGALVAKWEVKSRSASRCFDRPCRYARRGGEGDQAQRTVEVESHRWNPMEHRRNRRRMGHHIQRRKDSRLGVDRYGIGSYLRREREAKLRATTSTWKSGSMRARLLKRKRAHLESTSAIAWHSIRAWK